MRRLLGLAVVATVLGSICASSEGAASKGAAGNSEKTLRDQGEKALQSYLAVEAKGGTVADFQKVAAKAYMEGFADDQGHLDPKEKIPAEDRYAKVDVQSVRKIGGRLVVTARVKYKDAWVKAEEAELRDLGMTVPEAGQNAAAVRVKADAVDPTMDVRHPFQKNGVGSVVFVFVQEGGQWKFHGCMAALNPVEVVDP